MSSRFGTWKVRGQRREITAKFRRGIEIRQRTAGGRFTAPVVEYRVTKNNKPRSRDDVMRLLRQFRSLHPEQQVEVAIKFRSGIWHETQWFKDDDRPDYDDFELNEYGALRVIDDGDPVDVRFYLRQPPAGGFEPRRENNCLLQCLELWALKCNLPPPFGKGEWRFRNAKRKLGLASDAMVPVSRVPQIEESTGLRIIVRDHYDGRPCNQATPTCVLDLVGDHYTLATTEWARDDVHGEADFARWRIPIVVTQTGRNERVLYKFADVDLEDREATTRARIVSEPLGFTGMRALRTDDRFSVVELREVVDGAAFLRGWAQRRWEMWQASDGRIDSFRFPSDRQTALAWFRMHNPFELTPWPLEQQAIVNAATAGAIIYAAPGEFEGVQADMVGFYPSILKKEAPWGLVPVRPGTIQYREMPAEWNRHSCDIWHVRPAFVGQPWRRFAYRGRYHEFELSEMQRHGASFVQLSREVLHWERSQLAALSKLLPGYSDFWHGVVQRAKELGFSKEQQRPMKGMRTIIWGLLMQRNHKKRTMWHDDEIDLEQERLLKVRPSVWDDRVCVRLQERNSAPFKGLLPVLGTVVMARARVLMAGKICDAEAAGFRLRRTHTDSLLVECPRERRGELEQALGGFHAGKLGSLCEESAGTHIVIGAHKKSRCTQPWPVDA